MCLCREKRKQRKRVEEQNIFHCRVSGAGGRGAGDTHLGGWGGEGGERRGKAFLV